MIIISDDIRTARKIHHCDFCGGVIEKGEKYNRQASVDVGDFMTFKCHIHCKELASKLNMYDYDCGEGINDNIFEECICDYFEKNHSGEGWENKSISTLALIAFNELKEKED